LYIFSENGKVAPSGIDQGIARRRGIVTALRERLLSDLGNWRDRLPTAWRSSFADVDLDFDAVDRDSQLADGEAIWPQEGSNKSAHLFKALRNLRPEQVRVVIFGNDPYTRITQATGRSFEQGDLVNWARDIRVRGRISPSMQSIVAAAAATDRKSSRYSLCDTRMLHEQEEAAKEPAPSQAQPIWFAHVEFARGLADGAIKLQPPGRIFDYWTKQGVLWLNRTLTYTKWDQAHRDAHRLLWAPFTARMLEVLVRQGANGPVVFVLWGGSAKQLEPEIRSLASKLGVKPTAVRCCKSGHPQWVAEYFKGGNPLAAINQAIGKSGKAIAWL
jgi:uracil-DNA glycosylase